ncbi:MAG: hypothetical protein WDA22_03875 [Bacteroidota bacterium]
MKTNTERRKFFKKAGISAVGAGLLSALPFKLFSQSNNEVKNPEQQGSISININPMAVKREKRK